MSSREIRTLPAITLIAWAALAAHASPADPAPSKNSPAATPAAVAKPSGDAPRAAPAGMMIFIDPVTGKTRLPDASEAGALLGHTASQPTKQQAIGDGVRIEGPNGAIGMKLSSDSLSYTVLTKKPDGDLLWECVTGEGAATQRIAIANSKADASAGK